MAAIDKLKAEDEKSLERVGEYIQSVRKGEPATIRELKEKVEGLQEKFETETDKNDKTAINTEIDETKNRIKYLTGLETALRAIEDLSR